MGRRSIKVRDIVEIYRHWQAGRGLRSISQALGVDRNTIRKYVRAAVEAGFRPGEPRPDEDWSAFVRQRFPESIGPETRSSKFGELDQVRDEIAEGLKTNHLTTVWQRVCRDRGLSVSLTTLRRYVACVMPEARLSADSVTVIRPEVEPGEEAQLDFGHLGSWRDPITGRTHRLWIFAMVMSFSRHMFIRVVTRLDSRCWLSCHVEAFEYFGGTRTRLVMDNLKDGVVKPDLYDPRFNRSYEELAAHYGVLIDPARRAHAKDKPRVERVLPFIRDSYWRGRSFSSLDEICREARRWCLEVAGVRTHGTTRARPLEQFNLLEKPVLHPLPDKPWELAVWQQAKVAPDAHCCVRGTLYSVPWRYLGRQLSVRVTDTSVAFYLDDELVKTHLRRPSGRRQTDPSDLPPDKIAFFLRTPQWCRSRSEELGDHVCQVIHGLLEVNTLAHLRQVQGILRLADTYGAKRLDAACARALAYGDSGYRTVRAILMQGLDQQPVDSDAAGAPGVGAFLRGPEAFHIQAAAAREG